MNVNIICIFIILDNLLTLFRLFRIINGYEKNYYFLLQGYGHFHFFQWYVVFLPGTATT